MSHDHQTDEEIIDQAPPRHETLSKAAIQHTRKLGPLTVRKITAESLSYLFEVENFYIKGLKGERVAPANANAIWATAEFVYIHSADPNIVAETVWHRDEFREGVRGLLANELNDPKMLMDALPMIEEMVREYFAAQTDVAATGKTKLARPGKALARHGKRAT